MLVERLRLLVSQLMPPASEILVCHVDAPSWCVLDLGATKQPSSAKPSDLFASKTASIIDASSRLRDDKLGINARVDGGAVFWEWNPIDGLSVYGRLTDADRWDDLVSVAGRIDHSLKTLFALKP